MALEQLTQNAAVPCKVKIFCIQQKPNLKTTSCLRLTHTSGYQSYPVKLVIYSSRHIIRHRILAFSQRVPMTRHIGLGFSLGFITASTSQVEPTRWLPRIGMQISKAISLTFLLLPQIKARRPTHRMGWRTLAGQDLMVILLSRNSLRGLSHCKSTVTPYNVCYSNLLV